MITPNKSTPNSTPQGEGSTSSADESPPLPVCESPAENPPERPQQSLPRQPARKMSENSSNKDMKISGPTFFCEIAICTAMVVIGSLKIEDCAADPRIPVGLIVAGGIHLFAILCHIFLSKRIPFKIYGSISAVYALLWLGCLITGSVWIFPMYSITPRDCDATLFYFCFSILIIISIFLYPIVLFLCLAGLCMLICRGFTREESEDAAENNA